MVVTLLLLVVPAGCAGDPPEPAAPDKTSPAAVTAKLDRVLRYDFEGSFAGVEEHDGRIIVYRVPSVNLDNRVYREAGEIPVDYRDAKYSIKDMHGAIGRIRTDDAALRARGVVVMGLAATKDGSGIAISTALGNDHDRAVLTERYPDLDFTLAPAAPKS
ncbi:hypothetical protein D5S17_17215 [Pseudonocardiaceae bacterium YIM PH 21723]|nr:hypothetical protein D5S17_17215 [Pseudonocardiaceae bacterium YIM PH 21723]